MITPETATIGGLFVQLMPLLSERTVMMIVSKADDQHLTVSVIPKRMKDSENTSLSTPLSCTGTPEELDRELPTQLREFVIGHVTLGNNLAEIQRERDEAEKAAREEARKRQKSVGNGGKKPAEMATSPTVAKKAEAEPPTTLSLFDQAEAPAPTTPAQPDVTEPL